MLTYLLTVPYLGPTINYLSGEYKTFVTSTFNNTMSFGLYGYVGAFSEAKTELEIIVATFTAPIAVVTGMTKLFKNMDELIYDIKSGDDKGGILDLIDYFILPGDQDERLGGDTYGS